MAAISLTASQILAGTGAVTTTGTLAEAVTQGQAVYVLANGTIGLADSNAASPANVMAGIALTAGSTGQPVVYCTGAAYDFANAVGGLTLGAGASLSIGDTIWLYSTAGNLTKTAADVASGMTSIVLGDMVTTTILNFIIVRGGQVA